MANLWREESKKSSEAQERRLVLNTKKVEKFKGDLAILEACIASFGSPAENVFKLITEGILFVDMRLEIMRVEETMQRLIEKKNDLISTSTGVTDLDLEGFKMRIRKG